MNICRFKFVISLTKCVQLHYLLTRPILKQINPIFFILISRIASKFSILYLVLLILKTGLNLSQFNLMSIENSFDKNLI